MSNKHHELLGVPKHANQHRLSRLTMEAHTDELRIMASAVESYTDELISALEAAEKRIAVLTEKPIGWTDEQELRDVEKLGCGYLFRANPITPHADPRRVILLYAAAAGKGE